MTVDLHKIPPQSKEAEMSVIGGILLDNSAIDIASVILSEDDFYRQSHRLIFRAAVSIANNNEPIDLVTMAERLKLDGDLNAAGGGAYLSELIDYVPTAANIAYYCKIVREKATERRFLESIKSASEMIMNGEGIAEAVSSLESVMLATSGIKSSHPVNMRQSVKEATDRIETRYQRRGQIQGIPYGIDELDKATSGMHNGELIIIAGRPSMGKSALAGNILSTVCKGGLSGLLYNLEMSRLDIMDRLAAAYGINYGNIRNGWLKEIDLHNLTRAMGEIYQWSLWIDDTPAISLREIRAKAKHQARTGKLDLLVVDYLQLMRMSNAKDNRTQGLGEVSRGLKQLARELDIPVIALSQLSRAVDSRPDKRPMMSDLRDSGEIEQDADVILFPYREAAYCQKCRDRVNDSGHNYREHQAKAEIIVEKQRNGARNISVPAIWIGEYQRFEGV
jgi:replicative DNA helicase